MPVSRFEATGGDGRKHYIRQFDGVYDLSDIAARRAKSGIDSLGNASISGKEEFTGTSSLEEAISLCDSGWPEGVERIEEVLDKVEFDAQILQSANRLTSHVDVAGDEPDIDRYLQNEPEDMVTYYPALQSHGMVADIIINIGQHAYVDKAQIINRGAAILAAVEALRSHGYSIGIVAVERCKSSNSYTSERKIMQNIIPILSPGEPVNVDTLAFSMMHPSFLRRLLFAANEEESEGVRREFGYYTHGGYGQPLSIADYQHDRPAFIVDKNDGLVDSSKDVARYAQKLAQLCLKVLQTDNEVTENDDMGGEGREKSERELKLERTTRILRRLGNQRKRRRF